MVSADDRELILSVYVLGSASSAGRTAFPCCDLHEATHLFTHGCCSRVGRKLQAMTSFKAVAHTVRLRYVLLTDATAPRSRCVWPTTRADSLPRLAMFPL